MLITYTCDGLILFYLFLLQSNATNKIKSSFMIVYFTTRGDVLRAGIVTTTGTRFQSEAR